MKPPARWGHSSCIVKDSLYIFGGFASNFFYIKTRPIWMICGAIRFLISYGNKSTHMVIFRLAVQTVLFAMILSMSSCSCSEVVDPTNKDLTLSVHSIWRPYIGFKFLLSKARLHPGNEHITLHNLNFHT